MIPQANIQIHKPKICPIMKSLYPFFYIILFCLGSINSSYAQCEIFDIIVEPGDCDFIGNYSVDFSIEYNNFVTNTFDVQVEYEPGIAAEEYGPFEYGQVFYTIGPLNGASSTFTINISDSVFPDCGISYTSIAPDCNGSTQCAIDVEWIEFQPCNPAGGFNIHLGVGVDNPVGSAFTITGNGMNYGTFEYGLPFYEIGPFADDPNAVYELILTDADDASCQTVFVFDGIDCNGGGDCAIDFVELAPSPCEADGTFDLVIDVGVQNTTNDFIDIIYNGEVIAFAPLIDFYVVQANKKRRLARATV